MKKSACLLFAVTVAITLVVSSSFGPFSVPGAIAQVATLDLEADLRPKPPGRGTPTNTTLAGGSHAVLFNRPKPPGRGTPGNAGRGGGSRTCLKLATKSEHQILNGLNALVPESKQGNTTEVWGYTTEEHPSLWFYIPYTSDSIKDIELTLLNDRGEPLQVIPVSVPANPGVLQVQLPKDKPGLQPGQFYNWFFKVRGNCAENTIAFVEGWISRTADTTLASQLDQATPEEKLALLAKNGIWFDALTAAAQQSELSQSKAADTTAWAALLKQTDMGILATQPIVK